VTDLEEVGLAVAPLAVLLDPLGDGDARVVTAMSDRPGCLGSLHHRSDNTRGSVHGTAETLLDVYRDPTLAAPADGCDLNLDELLTGPTLLDS
jgi:hypothetical protein